MEHAAHYALGWAGADGFMPHGHCYLWTPELLWTYVIAESVIVLSYLSIALALWYFVGKRRDLQFNWMFKLFSLFIFACGATHAMGIWTIWHPDYWLDALVKAATALVSLVAAILIWPLIPRALKLPSTKQLEDAVTQLQQEVGQRKEAESELARLKQASDERYRILFEQAAVGVAELDSNTGAFLHANGKYCDILGYDRKEILNINCHAVTYPDDLPLLREKMRALKEGAIPEFSLEQRQLRKDGSIIWASITVSPMWQPGMQPGTHIAVVQDITARKQAETTLNEQFSELHRWHETTLGRESRVLELKREVNELLAGSGLPPRYPSAAAGGDDTQT